MPLTSNGVYYANMTAPLSQQDIIAAMATSLSDNGGVLQAITAQQTSPVTNSSDTTYAFSGLTASITPISESSKILVFVNLDFDGQMNTDGTGAEFILERDGITVAKLQKYVKNAYRAAFLSSYKSVASLNYLDEPKTLSRVTYQVSGKIPTGIAGVLYMNTIPSTITLLEIQ